MQVNLDARTPIQHVKNAMQAPQYIAEAPKALRAAITFLDENINQTIADIKDDFESPTMALQVGQGRCQAAGWLRTGRMYRSCAACACTCKQAG